MNRLMDGQDVHVSGGDRAGDGTDPAPDPSRDAHEEARDGAAGERLPANTDDAQRRIESAREAARKRRRELGLPDLPPEEVTPPKRGKRSAKRTKSHGQFMRQGSQ
jgi:hypothetical protein